VREIPQASGTTLYDTADMDEGPIECAFCTDEDGVPTIHAPQGFHVGFRHDGAPCLLRVRLCEVCMTLRPFSRQWAWIRVAKMLEVIGKARRAA